MIGKIYFMDASVFIGVIINWKDSKSSSGDRTIILNQDILSAFVSIQINPSDTDPKVKPTNNTNYVVINYISIIDSKNKIVQFNTWSDSINGWTGVSDEDFATFMSVYSNSGMYTGGLIALYSAINEPLKNTFEVIDGNIDTYTSIGTNSARYIMQDFGGNKDLALPVKRIEWIVSSDIEKAYTVEAWDGNKWQIIYSGKSYSGENKKYKLLWTSPQIIYAVRIYHRGDYKVNSSDVDVNITKNDNGSGTSSYKISSYPDFRDASSRIGADSDGWISTINGSTIVPWNFISDIEYWQSEWSSNEKILDMKVFIDNLYIACESGNLYFTPNLDSVVPILVSSFDSSINIFLIFNDTIYIGTKNGKVFSSDNGVSWNLFIDLNLDYIYSLISYSSYSGILSLEIYNDRLYIGTDLNKLYNCDINGENLLEKTFFDRNIDGLKSKDGYLWITVSPSGKIYKYNGNNYSFIINTKVSSWGGMNIYSQDNNLYIYGNDGLIFKYLDNISTFYDSSSNKILDSVDAISTGPIITSIIQQSNGNLSPGNYIYSVSYVDFNSNESLIGQLYNINLSSNTTGSFEIFWNKVDNAKYYNLYRTSSVNQSNVFIKRLESNIISTNIDENSIERIYYLDNGSKFVSNISIPTTSKSNIWFSTDINKLYVYDNNSIIVIDGPSSNLIENIVFFNNFIYISCRNNLSENSIIYKFIGEIISSGIKKVYVQSKDNIDNISDIVYDDIYFDVLYDKIILEISNNSIVHSYSRTNKIISANKNYYRFGIYISEAFYSSNLSSWDVIKYIISLPENTEFDIYARTSNTKDGLETANWFGPGTEINDTSENYGYYDYEGDGYYSGPYDDYPGKIQNLSGQLDISTLSGKWIQFKIILKSYVDDVTPTVYSVLIKYFSVNAAYFFSSIFDISNFAANDYIDNPENIVIKRGLLSYNGSIPLGGDIQFGISDKNSNNWQDYQIIESGKIFEIEKQSNKFKIGILLISTNQNIALVHEFSLMFDSGNNFMDINKNLYNMSPFILGNG